MNGLKGDFRACRDTGSRCSASFLRRAGRSRDGPSVSRRRRACGEAANCARELAEETGTGFAAPCKDARSRAWDMGRVRSPIVRAWIAVDGLSVVGGTGGHWGRGGRRDQAWARTGSGLTGHSQRPKHATRQAGSPQYNRTRAENAAP